MENPTSKVSDGFSDKVRFFRDKYVSIMRKRKIPVQRNKREAAITEMEELFDLFPEFMRTAKSEIDYEILSDIIRGMIRPTSKINLEAFKRAKKGWDADDLKRLKKVEKYFEKKCSGSACPTSSYGDPAYSPSSVPQGMFY